jgi:hypothetical protein
MSLHPVQGTAQVLGASGAPAQVVLRGREGFSPFQSGDALRFALHAGKVHLFDKDLVYG